MLDQSASSFSDALKALGIKHTVFTHPPMVNPEEVQGFLGEKVADCVASLVMKADGRFIVFLKKGYDHINFKRLKKH